MTKIIIIAAIADNNVIGSRGDIPWRISEDFQHFRELTMGHPCIMGDKTYESLPLKPLAGRENIVLTFEKNYNPPGTTVFHTFEDALKYCKDKEKTFICGGASIYRLGMKAADMLELTRVHQSPEGDTFFPEINLNEWELRKEENHDDFTFQTFVKRKASRKGE